MIPCIYNPLFFRSYNFESLIPKCSLQKQEFNEDLQLDDEDEEVEFVLTDEWREFFAKSEAKRRAGNASYFSKLLIF